MPADNQQGPEQELVGTWTVRHSFSASIPIDPQMFNDYIDGRERITRMREAAAWEQYIARQRDEYLDCIIDLCNTPVRTYMRRHFQ